MSKLLEQIGEYWTNRTDGYSDYNDKELAGMQRKAWLEVLQENFPQKSLDELKIVDIGTGPGFFPIILSEAGYSVTAVDYTASMLEKAKENAGNLAEKVDWYQMDAQKLEFEDESFDVVISRNVTWNLEDPQKAYREWFRVLKPGGILLNFDANWYGYLFDDAKRLAYEKDRENVSKQEEMDDYFLDTDVDAMEDIARKVPMSKTLRPEWDMKVLKEIGFLRVGADKEVWKRVWSEEEKLNQASTPMFMLYARKAEEDCFQLENMTAWPGEKISGDLQLASDISLPTTIINGNKPGKTMLITAGVHAEEYSGIEAAMELAAGLRTDLVVGTILIVKVVNLPAFLKRSGSGGITDGKNLNRQFPGNPEGSEMERLAWVISEKLFAKADYYIDLHSGDFYEELTPFVYYAGVAEKEVADKSREMAQQVDVPYMVRSSVASGGAYNHAASIGIPSIVIKRGGMGQWNPEESGSTRRDVRNILCHLGMYEAEKDYRQYYPLDVVDVVYQAASHEGLWYPAKHPGDVFVKGEILGAVQDFQENCRELVRSVSDGVILYQTGSLQVTQAGPMIAYGRIVHYYDNRKERIVNYWDKRSDSFMSQRRHELHSPLAERWLKEIREHMPASDISNQAGEEKEGKKLRILDVGCGSGFFSILLGIRGYKVTGTDLTPSMIQCSKKLAEEEGADCEFMIMDAENLDFEDQSFDMVISRNLTWTLPHAEQAYSEWMRVLKPGGVLLNFDANYGRDNSADTSNLPKYHAHNTLGDLMLRENEEIKKQLPISSYIRPAWDLETLGQLGFEDFSIDLGLSKRIYVEKDEFYNPVPMFLLAATKR